MGNSRKPLKVFKCDWLSLTVLFASIVTVTQSPDPFCKTTALLPETNPACSFTSHRHTSNTLFFQTHATEFGVPLVNMGKWKNYMPLTRAVYMPAKRIQIVIKRTVYIIWFIYLFFYKHESHAYTPVLTPFDSLTHSLAHTWAHLPVAGL